MNSKSAPSILPAVLLLAFSAMPARSAVTDWRADKGVDYLQTADSLTNSFQSLATDLPYPQNSYTDTTHTAEDAGFYFIDVQMAN